MYEESTVVDPWREVQEANAEVSALVIVIQMVFNDIHYISRQAVVYGTLILVGLFGSLVAATLQIPLYKVAWIEDFAPALSIVFSFGALSFLTLYLRTKRIRGSAEFCLRTALDTLDEARSALNPK